MATQEKLENNQVQLDITVSAQDFSEGLQKAYKKNAKRYNLPGFRKGKAPRKMIEKAYGEGVFYEAAFEEVYWGAYVSAVEEKEIIPVDAPDITIEEIGEGKDLRFSAKVVVKPTVTVDDKAYKGIEVSRVEYTVTDDQVEAEVERQRERLARYVDVERPVKTGDRILLDYSGSVDGVKFDGGTAEKQNLDIGAGQFIPGFEEQIVGHTIGEEFDINVTFPEDYRAEHLKGKDAVFTITVHEIKEKQLLDLDDEFAKDVSDFETMAEYRADIRARYEKDAQTRAQNEMRTSAVDALVSAVEIDVPDAMVERQIDRAVQDMSYRLQGQGMSMDDYLKYAGSDMAAFRDQMREDAGKRVRADLILEAIVKQEDIVADEAEVEAEVEKLAQSVGKSIEETRKLLRDSDMESIKNDLAINQAVQLLLDNAKMIDAPKEKKKPAAKKAAAKSETAKAADKAVADAQEGGDEKPAPKKRAARKPKEE